MIEEPRLVAPYAGVDHDLVVHREQHGVRIAGGFFLGISRVGDVVTDALAGVFDQALPGRNAPQCECALAGDRRRTDFEVWFLARAH